MQRKLLVRLYIDERLSMKEIALQLGCSVHKIEYWMKKYTINRRGIGEAIFIKKHGLSNGFLIKEDRSESESILYGLGLGIYWGEGNKKNLNTVRMGNTDPLLVKTFVCFLTDICGVSFNEIRYGLQLFSDCSENKALEFWKDYLKTSRKQIMPTVNRIKSGKIGTYKMKNQFGVMTVYVFNTKLRNWLVDQLYVPR